LKGGVVTTPSILTVRPSLESLRKQAKKLARDIAAGNADAVARARAQLPRAELPLSQRDAQLVLAREYGFTGWQHLREEVLKRTANSLEWAGAQAQRAIHDNDIERLTQLLREHPALLAWRDDVGETLLGSATGSFGDSGDPYREQMFTRPASTELLIDAGAVVDPPIWESVISARAKGMLQLLWNKGVLPRTLTILAALGDLDGVRACFDESGALRAGPGNADGLATVNEAFMCACRFKHKEVASVLLGRCIALDADLGRRIDAWQGRSAFIDYLGEHAQRFGLPWQTLVVNEVRQTIVDDDLPAFSRWQEGEPYLLGESSVGLQVELLELATVNNRERFIVHLLDRAPAMLQHPTPPPSSALGFALEYGHAHLVPLLTRIWPLPDDLAHAAGVGDLAGVKRWFDAAGQPALGDLNRHHPANNPQGRANLHWGTPRVQHVLDVALAWACMNHHFEVASFLLEHGADIDTNWSTHEPASMLHECAWHGNYDAARFLIDRGIDMTRLDYRWNATAEGWARHAAKDEQMADFLAAAEREQSRK
jgi:ankyrin repeat protein